MRSVEGVGHAVEVGVGILDADLLDNPPDGHTVGDMTVYNVFVTHARVQDSERISLAREDKRTRVSWARKVTEISPVVIHGDIPRLFSELGAGIGFHSRVPTKRKPGHAAVLGNNIERITVLVLRIGIDDETTRKSTTDGELGLGWEPLVLTSSRKWPEAIREISRGILMA